MVGVVAIFANLKIKSAHVRVIVDDAGPSVCRCARASAGMTTAEGYYVQVAQRMQGL